MEITIKYDYELTNEEVGQIIEIYNQCFHGDQLRDPRDKAFIGQCVAELSIYKWYLLKDVSHTRSRIIGIAAFVYDYTNSYLFELNLDLGENLCNVGVLPQFRKRGYARKIMESVIKDFQENRARVQDPLILGIKKANPMFKALSTFYQSLGFQSFQSSDTDMFMYWCEK